MAIVADSGGIYGLYDSRDFAHVRLREAVERERTRIIIPAVALGEIDYLLRVRLGSRALVEFLSDVEKGAFEIEPVTSEDLRRCRSLIIKYANLDLGLCDSAVVAVAERLGVDCILTVDQRDFRAVRSSRGRPFRLLPSDRG